MAQFFEVQTISYRSIDQENGEDAHRPACLQRTISIKSEPVHAPSTHPMSIMLPRSTETPPRASARPAHTADSSIAWQHLLDFESFGSVALLLVDLHRSPVTELG